MTVLVLNVCYHGYRLVAGTAWDTLNTWLNDAKSEDNKAFLVELLSIYKHLPVNIDVLKRNSCAKTIKQLAKTDDESK